MFLLARAGSQGFKHAKHVLCLFSLGLLVAISVVLGTVCGPNIMKNVNLVQNFWETCVQIPSCI